MQSSGRGASSILYSSFCTLHLPRALWPYHLHATRALVDMSILSVKYFMRTVRIGAPGVRLYALGVRREA
jgi:hypothetical protein